MLLLDLVQLLFQLFVLVYDDLKFTQGFVVSKKLLLQLVRNLHTEILRWTLQPIQIKFRATRAKKVVVRLRPKQRFLAWVKRWGSFFPLLQLLHVNRLLCGSSIWHSLSEGASLFCNNLRFFKFIT